MLNPTCMSSNPEPCGQRGTALLEPEEEIMPLKKFIGIFLIHQIECNAKSVLAVIYNLRRMGLYHYFCELSDFSCDFWPSIWARRFLANSRV